MWSINNFLKRLPIYLTDITEERARIARELHDVIAQELAAIGYALDGEIGRADTTIESRKALRAIREEITNLNEKVRREIFQLRSSRQASAQEQLEEALGNLDLDFAIIGRLPSDTTGVELFKVLVELARNAHDHGKAASLGIDIAADRITVENDGLSSHPTKDERFGLVGIAERLLSIGWEISSQNGFATIELLRVK